MRVCPLCDGRYDDGVRTCPLDGRRPLLESVVIAAQGDPLLGATLGDRYTIVGRVGAGGMGTVYRAEQAPMNREIALKVLRKDLGRDPETVARFHREAHTLSALKHPNTVTIFDFGQTDDGLLFLAMELLEGEMLSSRLKRVGPMDVPVAIRNAAGVLRSLAEAHSRGIIHRDLKPDNIFLARVHARPEESEMVKVVDFGIAKIRDGDRNLEPLQTQEGTVFGTPRYMSPEQAQGKTLDGRSDLYAVGVLLFHMLTGQPPFTDDDAVVVMAHHIKTVPPPVRTIAPSRPIPAALEKLVQRALEKDPLKRPQTAEAFLADLEATLDEAKALAASALAPDTVRSVPPPKMGDAPWWRSRTAAAGSALVLAIGAAVAYGLPRHVPHAAAIAPAAIATSAHPAVLPASNGPVASASNAPTPPPVQLQARDAPAPQPPTEPDPVNTEPVNEAAPAAATTHSGHATTSRSSESSHASGGHSGHRSRHGDQPYNRWSD